MKIINSTIYEGRNIYSHKKCIKLEVDLEGYCEIPSKDIPEFNEKLVSLIPELNTHRCGIDEDGGFVKRLIEGTYLAHICEHIIIAIQNILGIDVAYGKAREIAGDRYIIVYQYEYPKVAIESARLAIDIINRFIKDEDISFEDRMTIIKQMLKDETVGPSTKAICSAARNMDMPVLKLGSSGLYQIGYGKQGRVVEASIGAKTSCVATDISCDKLLTKELLSIQNIPVSEGAKVSNVINLLKEGERIGYPVVIKPQYGNKGNGVILDIKDEKQLLEAYVKLSLEYKDILIEKYYKGDDYRVCVIDYKVVAVTKRISPYIVGDGANTIKDLIDEINSDNRRGEGHEKPLTKIKIDDLLISRIGSKGYSLSTILAKNEKLFLRKNANLSTGGVGIDYTDKISEFNKELCIRAAKTIGLDICGIDICTEDISKKLNGNGVIIEINAAPGLRMHIYPYEGKSRDVGSEIVNMMYKNNVANIPVISITGTNGKTTTTRLINNTLSKMGYSVGMTSTEGIYINNRCIHIGDDTGADSARCILQNKDVEVAVLETARGGIIKKGLAYDVADVAIITNITEDHLGVDGINNMEDLCRVKSLVAEAVKSKGHVVINADDKWSRNIINRVKANIIYFSKDSNNELILRNIKENKTAVYVKDEFICVNNLGKEYKVININNIPITLNGKLEFNTENAMATCAGLVALNIDYSMIKIGLESFELNSRQNAGRFNIYDYNGVKIVLDYGHNVEGYRTVLKSLRNITNKNIIGVIGIPGDRTDEAAINIGRISAKYLNKIIIKEDLDKRNRKNGEIAELIKKGVSLSKDLAEVQIILDEVDAFREALSVSEKGDTIIVFYEKRNPILKVLKEICIIRDDLDEIAT